MARPVRIRRKDLKRPDEFVTTTRRLLEWVQSNRRGVTWGGAAAALAVTALVVALALGNLRRRDANADLARALEALRNQTPADAGLQLAEVARRWSTTSAGRIARLLEASTELRRANFDSALVSLETSVAASHSAPYLKQQALVSYAFALEAKGDTREAIARYEEAADLEGPYAPFALLSQARCYQAAGKGDEAARFHQQLQEEFPDVARQEGVTAREP